MNNIVKFPTKKRFSNDIILGLHDYIKLIRAELFYQFIHGDLTVQYAEFNIYTDHKNNRIVLKLPENFPLYNSEKIKELSIVYKIGTEYNRTYDEVINDEKNSKINRNYSFEIRDYCGRFISNGSKHEINNKSG